MCTYIFTEREREEKRGGPDPVAVSRVATYWYLLRPEMCTGRHKSPHSHGVPNLHILHRVLLSISFSHSLSLTSPSFATFFPSSFLVGAPLPPLPYAVHRVFLWHSSWIFCFFCLTYADTTNRFILHQIKDSLASWNVREIVTNKLDNMRNEEMLI